MRKMFTRKNIIRCLLLFKLIFQLCYDFSPIDIALIEEDGASPKPFAEVLPILLYDG
jgi:hypothetical protein